MKIIDWNGSEGMEVCFLYLLREIIKSVDLGDGNRLFEHMRPYIVEPIPREQRKFGSTSL